MTHTITTPASPNSPNASSATNASAAPSASSAPSLASPTRCPRVARPRRAARAMRYSALQRSGICRSLLAGTGRSSLAMRRYSMLRVIPSLRAALARTPSHSRRARRIACCWALATTSARVSPERGLNDLIRGLFIASFPSRGFIPLLAPFARGAHLPQSATIASVEECGCPTGALCANLGTRVC